MSPRVDDLRETRSKGALNVHRHCASAKGRHDAHLIIAPSPQAGARAWRRQQVPTSQPAYEGEEEEGEERGEGGRMGEREGEG